MLPPKSNNLNCNEAVQLSREGEFGLISFKHGLGRGGSNDALQLHGVEFGKDDLAGNLTLIGQFVLVVGYMLERLRHELFVEGCMIWQGVENNGLGPSDAVPANSVSQSQTALYA